ncbi:hypothetical protein PCYB_005270, partial [Plasmodium cynomolgi strain B]
ELWENNQNGISTNLKCNRNFKRVFDIKKFKKKNNFHDFLVIILYSIHRILESRTHVKQDYCDYIYYILQLYNNTKEACYSRIPETCPDEIKLFQNKIIGYDLSHFKNKCLHVSNKFTHSNLNALLDQLNKEQTKHIERVKWPFKYRKLINYDIFYYFKIFKEEEESTPVKQNNVSNETEECTNIMN